MLIQPNSATFDDLLRINAWAHESWSARQSLVQRQVWNMSYRNQAGNKETADWLNKFNVERRRATRVRLNEPREFWRSWTAATGFILEELNRSFEVPEYLIGSRYNGTDMPPYDLSFFIADVLLLADSDLTDEIFTETLDISGYQFPSALHAFNLKCGAPFIAENTSFGDHTQLTFCKFMHEVSFKRTRFGKWNNFLASNFQKTANFEMTRFGFEGSFTAARFEEDVSFSKAVFEGTAPFCGAYFSSNVDFSDTVFMGNVDFGNVSFKSSANFEGADFQSAVCTTRLPRRIRLMIEGSIKSESRSTRQYDS